MSTPRGTSNGNESGSSYDRRRRRLWLLAEFGDGTTAPCALGGPDEPECLGSVDLVTLTVPGCRRGRYVRGNIRPACGPCNSRKGGALRRVST